MAKNRKDQKEKILKFFQTKTGLSKLKKIGVQTSDDFGNILDADQIIKNIAYNKIELALFTSTFGEKWISENWSSLLELLYSKTSPDCLVLTLQDVDGNNILSAYINSFQLFGSLEYKKGISAAIAYSVYNALISLPTDLELSKALKENDKEAISLLKKGLDYFKGEERNNHILNIVEKNSPKLRELIKEKTGY